MDNMQFLTILKESFVTYLNTGSRSNKKLKILHGAISKDLYERLGDERYSVYSLGYEKGREHKITGRYINKAVDITVAENNAPIAGIAVKYVMSNYSQNSNNYFENMLGETANIRSAGIPYFQIFIIPDKVPYFDEDGNIANWESINEHNINKYIVLSRDNINDFLHTPNKTLVFIVHIDKDNTDAEIENKNDYKNYYLNNNFDMRISDLSFDFENTVVYNDYDKFMEKIVHAIKSI